ncbi:Wzz/FepE/Etk N-terminal domain-containing protein [Goekera deserti]|uniref:Polysaccharide chain length determinant N-terminal domain-containing protein n=1 Tax=Goekera deserti TaxID=2497753 RepID=A0A7K3WEU3_9ACTN|nr:Wzz/FepE/Etk N-terminal domain-containing protein [Goekera deserti]NDI48603.1 hypothetical protein [Goekera deserti]NEL55018.1 hypothetical protein [Goekera deserti]
MLEPTASASEAETTSVVGRALWRARWAILAAALVAAVGGYLLSSLQAETYTATGRVVLTSSQDFDPLGNQPFGDPSRFVANQVAIIGTQPVLDIALGQLDDDTTLTELSDSLEVTGSTEDDLVTVNVSAETGQEAADRVNAVIDAYRQYSLQRVADEAAQAIAATTTPSVADQIQTQAAVYGDGVYEAVPALVPMEPSAPNPLRDGAILAAVAALAVCGIALARRSPSRRPESGTDVGGPRVLGTVRAGSGGGRGAGTADTDRSTDAAMALVALDYARRDTPGPVLVTGATKDSGQAEVAYGLAVSAAGQGRRVLLVDADPEARALLATAGVAAPPRVLDELGSADGGEVDVVVPLSPAGLPTGAVLGLATLGWAEGPVRLDEEGLSKALSRLAGSYDLVLLQSAPITVSPLAYALVGQAGGVVAAVGPRESDQLPALQHRVESAQRPLTGVVHT